MMWMWQFYYPATEIFKRWLQRALNIAGDDHWRTVQKVVYTLEILQAERIKRD